MYINSKPLAIVLGIGSTLMQNAISAASNTTTFDESMLSSLPGMGSSLPALGSNINGGSVFSNYVKARKDGQFFMLNQNIANYEKPSSEKVEFETLFWCSDLKFTDIDGNTSDGIGYTARCVQGMGFLDANLLTNANNAGAQLPHSITKDEFSAAELLSAVYVPQSNTFEGQLHKTTDNYVFRFWDDGRPTTSVLIWEVYDEGDTSPNAATSSLNGAGTLTWISVDEAASLLNNNAEDFTPEKFTDIYAEVWSAQPKIIDDTDVDAEDTVDGDLADEVKKDELAPVADGTEDEDDGSDGEEADDGTNDDSSGTTRRLSVVMLSTILGYF